MQNTILYLSICPIVYLYHSHVLQLQQQYSILYNQPIPGDLGYDLNENFTIWMNLVDNSLV